MTQHHPPVHSGSAARPQALVLEIAVGTSGPALLHVDDAVTVARAAEADGVTALRLLDDGARSLLDPSLLAGYLGGVTSTLGLLPDVPTTRNAPYNVARRVLSLDRATAGRSGVVLRLGVGDEVSEAVAPDREAADPGARWSEYLDVLSALWASFPREALIADQDAGVFVDDTRVRPIVHVGRFYRVRGPLDGPSSVQGLPVRVAVAEGLDRLEATVYAPRADVVVVEREHAGLLARGLGPALAAVGRERDEVALLGRVTLTAADVLAAAESSALRPMAAELAAWIDVDALDGLVLTLAEQPVGVAALTRAELLDAHLALVELAGVFEQVGHPIRPAGATLRQALGLATVHSAGQSQEGAA